MTSRSRAFSKLAKDIDVSGNITTEGIAPTVDLGGGVTVYASAANLPVSGNTAGDQAFVTGTGRLYIFSGVGWYNVALINNTPIIQSVLDSDLGTTPFTLANDGTATTITITAVDSDGETITYASSADSDFSGLATISQSSNVFTITPFSQDSATTSSGTITFTATDGINTATSATQTFTLNFVSSLWDEITLSIGTSSTNSLDNSTFIDRSTNAHTVTPTGSPVQTAFHPYLDNWSVEFNGSNQGVHLGTTALDNLSSTFSMEAWIYPRSLSTASPDYWNNGIIAKGNTYLNFGISNNGRVQLYHYSGQVQYRYSTGTVNINEWTHIGVTVTGGTITFYINGVASGTGTWLGMASGHVGTDCYVGTTSDGNAGSHRWFDGWIADARVVDGSVVVPDPSTKATAVTNTLFLVNTSNRLQDLSGNYTPTPFGTPKVSAFNPFGQESEYTVGENKGSVLFDTTSYLTAPQIPFGTADFTVEAWHFLNSRAELYPILFSNYNSFSTGSFSLIAGHNSSTTTQYQIAWNGGFPALNAGTIKYNEWVHFAVVRNSGTVTLYINGVSVGSFSGTQTINGLGNAVSVSYGADVPTTTQLDGYISDWTISAGTAKYTANFTPPSAPVGNTNADLYLPMDNAGIFDKTGNNTLTLVGDTDTSTTQTKFADTAVYFDGTGDYIETQEISGSNIWTIETWFRASRYYSGSGHFDRVWSYGTTLGNSLVVNLDQTNGAPVYRVNDTIRITSSSGINTNTWYHLALVCDGTNTIMYLNGTNVGSYGSSYSLGGKVFRLATLDGTQGFLSGYIENFQVLNGVAKYTANFTPPTQEQGRTYQAES